MLITAQSDADDSSGRRCWRRAAWTRLGSRLPVFNDQFPAALASSGGRDAVAIGYLDREGINHQDFATIEDGLRALAAGQLDAVVYDKPLLAWMVRQDYPGELQMVDLGLDLQNYAFGLPFASPLRQKLNIALVETTRSSWWRELVGKYIGGE
jgi:polar amino acid transport system substrate-binding protein